LSDERYFVEAVEGAADAEEGAVDFFDFLVFFLWVPVEAEDADVAVVAVVVVVSVFVVLVVEAGLSSANAAPSDRTATATRAESVFFIFFSIPCFCGRFGVDRQQPQRNLAATGVGWLVSGR
jgi:hypothetical protein